MGKSSSTTVGYWYEIAIHFGLGIGPFDEYLEFRGGDKTAWSGSATQSQSIQINAPNLWGGEKDQGGIVGTLDLMFGEADQQPSTRLAAIFGPQQPAWRGLATAAFAGRYGAMNPYPQKASHKIRKSKAGWDSECWYPEKAEIAFADDYVLAPDSSGWDYQVITHHSNPGTSNLTVPGSGWSAGGHAPFGDGAAGAANTNWPDKTILWVRRDVIIPGIGSHVLRVRAENGCVIFIDGTDVGAVNRDNIQIPNNQNNVFEIEIPGGAHTLAIKAFDEVSPPGAGTYLSVDVYVPALRAMNPAHVLYYARTHSGIGRVPVARMADASYRASADKLHAEGFGICTSYDPSSESLDEFEQRICRLIGGSVSRSLIDGQYYLDLARGEYVLDELPIITDDDILDITLQPSVPNGAINSVAVKYFDPQRKESITTPPVQALSLIDAFGVISQINDYPEIPAGPLALRVAERDVRASTAPTRTMELTLIPDAVQGIRPNQYFRLQSAKRRIADMVCLMGDRQAGTLKSGAVRITATEDIYSLPATSFAEIEPGVDTRPDPTPNPITLQAAFEAPYIELVQRLDRANLDVLPADAGYLLAVADQPPGARSYSLAVAASGGEFDVSATGDWCPFATVAGDATVVYSPVATSIPISAIQRGEQLVIGAAALWDSEIVRIDAIDIVAGAVVLGRGCADTVAAEHAGGSILWLYDAAAVSDLVEYTDGEVIDVKLLTNTGSAQLALSAAAPITVEFAGRHARPYPPARLRVNDQAYPSTLNAELTASWVHRDRVLQQDQLIDSEEATIGPEAGTTYTVRWYQPPATLRQTEAGISGTSSAAWTPPSIGQTRVTVEAVRGALGSWQLAEHTFDWTGTPVVTYAYATLNPNDKSSSLTLSNGNLTAARASGSAWAAVRSTIGKSRGKWYVEVTNDANGSTDGDAIWGLNGDGDSLSTYPGNSSLGANSMGWQANSTPNSVRFQNGSLGPVSGYGRVAPGQSSGLAIDFDAGKLWVRNSSAAGWASGGDPAEGTNPTFTFTPNTHLHFAVSAYSGPQRATVNFGASAFSGSVPFGFNAGLYAPALPGVFLSPVSFNASTANDAQGVATDGTHVWYSSSTTIYKYTAAGALITSRNVASDNPTTKSQINGMFIKDDVLYVSAAENSMPRKSWIVEYNPETLEYITHHALSGDWFSEGLAWKDGYWWVVFHATKVVAKVDPATWAVVATYPLSFAITGSSGGYGPGSGYDGIAWRGDYLFCNIHEIYDQNYLDVYYFDGVEMLEVGRLPHVTPQATQGIAIDPTNSSVFLFAERVPGGPDRVAKVMFG